MPRFAIIFLLVAGIPVAADSQADPPREIKPCPMPGEFRAKELKEGIKTFRLELNYNGDEDKPFYRLTVSVLPIGPDRNNPFHRIAQVSEEQASKIIDFLAVDGFLTKAVDLRTKKLPQPKMPGYTLKVGNFCEDLGWGLPMLKRLDGLRKMLDGDAAKGMDFLLTRLSGFRKQWEKETPPAEKEVYIPQDLDDSFAELKKILPKEVVEKMKTGPEKDMVSYHHGLGTSLRNNWGLWQGSRLSKWFNDKGIKHPDDMSGIILDSFWRHLNEKPLKLDEQIKGYQDYWKKIEEERKEQDRK